MARAQSIPVLVRRKPSAAQVKQTRKDVANRYLSKMDPAIRREIAEEARVRGCVQTAKDRALTVSAVLELRIQALDRLLADTRVWLTEQQRRAA